MPRTLAKPKIPNERQRQKYTDGQRKELRDYYNSQRTADSVATQLEIQQWYLHRYGIRIPRNVISKTLGPRYAYLDNPTPIQHLQMNNYKQRAAAWPDLEKALFEWQQVTERQRGEKIAGEVLKEKAAEFWDDMEMYRGIEAPQFSVGWLDGYKKRHGISGRYGTIGESTLTVRESGGMPPVLQPVHDRSAQLRPYTQPVELEQGIVGDDRPLEGYGRTPEDADFDEEDEQHVQEDEQDEQEEQPTMTVSAKQAAAALHTVMMHELQQQTPEMGDLQLVARLCRKMELRQRDEEARRRRSIAPLKD